VGRRLDLRIAVLLLFVYSVRFHSVLLSLVSLLGIHNPADTFTTTQTECAPFFADFDSSLFGRVSRSSVGFKPCVALVAENTTLKGV
jgi:hypothetical protein